MIIRSERVVTPDAVRPADVVVENGTIVEVRAPAGAVDFDCGELALLPGAVDVHVHINEPGRTHWEGFETATRAATAGGTTTLVDMPLNSSPCTVDVESFEQKLAAARGKLYCDVGFWGGVVPGNAEHLESLWDAGVLGFKAFLVDSGIDEFGWVGEETLREALPILATLDAPLLAHCEVAEPIAEAQSCWDGADPTAYTTWLQSRPPEAEVDAVEMLIRLGREFSAPVHVVHLATEKALDALRSARAEGARVTVETCIHYLTFAAEEIADGATSFKCAPPIRSSSTRDALWDALAAGDIDFVTTDHSPSPPELKCADTGRFDEAWGGIASVQLFLAALWTGAVERGHSLVEVARWASSAPASFAGLARKGRIAPGCDADLVVFDPEGSWTVDEALLFHRHAICPYVGRELFGRVLRTYVRGEIAYDGDHPGPHGRVLLRDSRR